MSIEVSMYTQQEMVTLRVGESKVIFDGTFILSALYMMQTEDWEVTAARPGYSNVTSDLNINCSMNCHFGDLYEVRLLSGGSYEVSFIITKLSMIESAEAIFNSSSIFNNESEDEFFTKEEADILKCQLDEMSAHILKIITQVANVTELTEAQNDYLKSSFNMLYEKLDTGSKESWRQATYGVIASVGCTFMPDVQTAQSLYQVASSYISSVPSMLLGGS